MKNIVLISLIVLFSACSPQQSELKPPLVVYPYDFYEKFNLRTLVSSYGKSLQYYCASYPKDFFEEYEVRTANSTLLILENMDRRLSFEMVAYNQVIITDEVKENQYKAQSRYTFYYDEAHDDFRVDASFIKKNENCKVYKRGHFKVDSNKIIKKYEK